MDDASRLLVLRARGRDAEAFGALVECHWARLVALARSVVGDADAEDAVQEGLVTAWSKLARLRDPEAFPAWIVRIVSRRCLRRARGRLRLLPWPEGRDDPDPRAQRPAEDVNVERTLSILPPRQRAVMHLTVVEGMSDTEIGDALGIVPASVRAHRRRAREALRGVLHAPPVAAEVGHEPAR